MNTIFYLQQLFNGATGNKGGRLLRLPWTTYILYAGISVDDGIANLMLTPSNGHVYRSINTDNVKLYYNVFGYVW